jgi:hypothetical protein
MPYRENDKCMPEWISTRRWEENLKIDSARNTSSNCGLILLCQNRIELLEAAVTPGVSKTKHTKTGQK